MRISLSSLLAVILTAMSGASFSASDYQFTLGANGILDYVLTSVSDTKVYYGDSLPSNDPTINLIKGARYEVTNLEPVVHPFEFIGKGSNAGLDVVLLSQGATDGSLESDVAIDFQDLGGGVVEFTVTQGLIDAASVGDLIPGYRCRPHASLMRGDFALFGFGAPIADPIPESIPTGSLAVNLRTIATGLSAPLGLVTPDDASGRMMIYDQTGFVYLYINGVEEATPFLDVSARLVPLGIVNGNNIGYDERGLLGFALAPDFTTSGKVYTYTSEPESGTPDFTTITGQESPDHHSVVAEWTVSGGDPSVVDAGSRREILRIDQPQFNHDGGEIAFGPDGMLYIALGDGGASDDQGDFGHGEFGNGQDIETILGTILRIDPSGDNSANGQYGIPADNPFVGVAGIDEIYAYGLRNPYRFSFDASTGDLWTGDVGQGKVEEIDVVKKGDNLGWPLKEGSFYFERGDVATGGFVVDAPALPVPDDVVDPIAEYDHDEGVSIIGGYVYRGSLNPALDGLYVFGEFGSFGSPTGRLFYLDENDAIQEFGMGSKRDIGIWIKGFGQDRDGEIYVLGSGVLGPTGSTGIVYRIEVEAFSPTTGWVAH